MTNGYEIINNVINIKRNLTSLDLFVKDFLNIFKKHSDYLVVSGYVSISTGRVRGTEDVDIIFPMPKKELFEKIFTSLESQGFWCYQGENLEEVFDYIKNMDSIRFAKKGEVFPNIELIPFDSTKILKYFEFNNPQMISISDFQFKIPEIEFEILYKELVLRGQKDVEDARHLRTFFNDILSEEKFKKYKEIIENEEK